jgi:hypothetical protein
MSGSSLGSRGDHLAEQGNRRYLQLFHGRLKHIPSGSPGGSPGGNPSGSPSDNPSGSRSGILSGSPSGIPSGNPSGIPSGSPSGIPSGIPSGSRLRLRCTHNRTGLLCRHQINNSTEFAQRPGLIGQARELQPRRRVSTDQPVEGQISACLIETITSSTRQQWDVPLQILAAVVGQHVIQRASVLAQYRRHAWRVIGVVESPNVGDSLHETESVVGVVVCAFGKLDGV